MTILAPAGCPWSFRNRGVSWIQILSAQSGTGSAVISYRVLPNAGRARAGSFGPEGIVADCSGIGGRSSTGCDSQVSTGFTITVTQAGH